MELARRCAGIAADKKARSIIILDLEEISPITRYFVIATGINRRQIQAIAEEIRKDVKRAGTIPMGVEGLDEARWVLIDLGDVVVHIMTEEARDFYDLEMLWGDAERVEIDPA
jgi:ribosome-associated protein